ncbi:MAG: outer membrane protein transport protein [Verrucomicrobiota bacterium]|jgi:long-chain fatty acid transport protein
MKRQLNQAAIKCHNKKLIGLVLLFGLVLGFVTPDRLDAVGFQLPNQDPEAIARGDAFAATADNPSAIYYNPAGITQLEGQNLSVGIYAISPGYEYKSPSGVTAKADSNFQPVPQIYYTCSFTNVPLSVGMGVYAPYGLAMNWGNHAPFNTLGESGKLLYLTFNPVIAWRINSTLSIAAGPTINYSQATLNQALDPSGSSQFKFNGDGTGFGFNAGILWQPHPMWSFGVNYHSATTLDYKGPESTTPSPPYPPSTSTSTSINFPQSIIGGVSFRPTTNWNFEFDLSWTEWSVVKQITFQDPTLGNPSITLDYRSSFIYDFGITRQLGKGYFASAGYIYSENSSPDANFNPLIPDANLQLGSIGFGHHGKRWNWAIAYHFAYNGGRNVSNDSNPQADGTYRTFNNAFNVSTTYKF